MMKEIERLQSLLGRYALHVFECEGTCFLSHDTHYITRKEMDEISLYITEQEENEVVE